MLLEFKVKNFKTFADEVVFSMTPAKKIQDIKYSVLKQKIANKEYKALSSAVIYGPNAAGKTNIISAMEVLKSIVLSGNVKNESSILNTPNETVRKLELIPNVKSTDVAPVEFGIKFIENDLLFEYGLKADIGGFLNEGYDRKILSEQLFVNGKMIFDRSDTVEIGDVSVIKYHLINDFNRSASEKMAKSNLDTKELFLTNMFKSVFSKDLSDVIVKWFKEKFMCVYQSNRMAIGIAGIGEKSKNVAIINKTVDEAIKHFGINANDIAYITVKDTKEASPHSMLQISGKKVTAIPVEIYESYGTERFLNVFPLVLQALEMGATLVIDEFDASIHPMAIMSIIGAFHNDEINKNNAQLIFNTHNPIFLNKNLFRRDEIKFIDRDDETGYSTHYSLSDFKTSGPNGVRNTDDYMKNYFINQYGSIRNIDFSEILRNDIMETSEEEV
jgi:AAA15 family ATPase/GTPase